MQKKDRGGIIRFTYLEYVHVVGKNAASIPLVYVKVGKSYYERDFEHILGRIQFPKPGDWRLASRFFPKLLDMKEQPMLHVRLHAPEARGDEDLHQHLTFEVTPRAWTIGRPGLYVQLSSQTSADVLYACSLKCIEPLTGLTALVTLTCSVDNSDDELSVQLSVALHKTPKELFRFPWVGDAFIDKQTTLHSRHQCHQ